MNVCYQKIPQEPRNRKVALKWCKSSDGIIWHGPKNGPGEAAARSLPLSVPQLKFLYNVDGPESCSYVVKSQGQWQ